MYFKFSMTKSRNKRATQRRSRLIQRFPISAPTIVAAVAKPIFNAAFLLKHGRLRRFRQNPLHLRCRLQAHGFPFRSYSSEASLFYVEYNAIGMICQGLFLPKGPYGNSFVSASSRYAASVASEPSCLKISTCFTVAMQSA